MQSYDFDYYQYKKKITKKSKIGFTFLFLAILVLLSTAIVIKPKNLGKIEFYFVEVDAFQTYKEASTLSQELQEKGGAGYIYFDGKYRVLASFYSNEQDATTVAENLQGEYSKSQVLTIYTLKKINTSSLSEKEEDAVLNISDECLKTIDALSNLALQYDKNEVLFSSLKIDLKKVASSFDEKVTTYLELTKNNAKHNVSKEYATAINSTINSLSEFENETNLSSTLKHSLTKIVMNYCSFVESF